MGSPPPDVTASLAALTSGVDWTYLERWVAEFAQVPGREGMPAALERLKAFRA
jgi:hypothetical protein